MKCLVISDGALLRQSVPDKAFFTRNVFVHFLDALSLHFEKLTLFAPVIEAGGDICREGMQKWQPSDNIVVVPAGDFDSVVGFYGRLWRLWLKNRRTLSTLLSSNSVALVRLPCTNAFVFAKLIAAKSPAYCCYVVGDQQAVVQSSSRYRGFSGMGAAIVGARHAKKASFLVKNAKASLFMGSALKDKFLAESSSGKVSFTSLVTEKDFCFRPIGNWPPSPLELITASRLTHEKGMDFLLEAVSLMLADKMDIRLTICGSGPDEARLQSLVKEKGLGQQVVFAGFVQRYPDLTRLFQKAHVFILPSLSEGIPKVIPEAMAAGLPVISTSVGGIKDIVRHNHNGLLVPPASPEQMVMALTRLCNETGLAARLQQAGYDFAKSHTIQMQARRLADTLQSAAKGD